MSTPSNSLLSKDDCVAIVRECIGSSDFDVIAWKTPNGDDNQIMGFLGDHVKAEITIIHGGHAEKLPFFIKMQPQKSDQAEFVQGTGAAKKEFIYYQLCEPELRSGVPPDERPWGCRCYLARTDLLVMEDLAVQGFRSYGARDLVDFDHCVLVMDALAALHAASLAYEEEKGANLGRPFRLIDEYPEMFVETFYAHKPYSEEYTQACIKATAACARLLPMYKDPMKRVLIEERLPKVLGQMYELVKPSTVDRNVLAHSDLWLNNVMFRLDAAGRPVEARLIDWQLLRYVPPVDDVLQFLHSCLPKSFRIRHEGALIDRYYASLARALARRGLSSERVLPRAALDASAARRLLLARLTALYMNHFVMLSAASLARTFADPRLYRAFVLGGDRAAVAGRQFAEDPAYRARVAETLEELIDEHVL